MIKFTGRLVRCGTLEGVAGAVIKIFDSDIGFDDLMASGVTEADGTFVIGWRQSLWILLTEPKLI